MCTCPAAVNFPDLLIVQGKYQFKPEGEFSPGSEVAGIVKSVGEGVKGINVGDHAIGSVPYGGYAQECAVPYKRVIPIPKAVPFAEAASVLMAYGTSHYALVDRASLKSGETVLVMGASGGVGLAAVQLAKAMGAKVIAAASDDKKLAVCKANGADVLINYGKDGKDMKAALKEACPEGIDVVYDPVGGPYSEIALRNMAWKGRFLVIGFAAGKIPEIPLNLALLKVQCPYASENKMQYIVLEFSLASWYVSGVKAQASGGGKRDAEPNSATLSSFRGSD